MTWLAVCGLALAAFLAMALWFKAPRRGWTMLGATLLIGLAGYAVQGSPDQPGAPNALAQRATNDPADSIAMRGLLDESDIPPTNQWIVIADAMARNGHHADAAKVLLGAVDDNPDNAQAWLALGNALVAHADGLLTPAALHAYQRAEKAAPDSPGPPYFLGLAMAQSGRFGEARKLWAELLEQSPADAPWRAALAERLARLDVLIMVQASQAAGR
jgi:cytochrome c-type biogenesis protein CcmH